MSLFKHDDKNTLQKINLKHIQMTENILLLLILLLYVKDKKRNEEL